MKNNKEFIEALVENGFKRLYEYDDSAIFSNETLRIGIFNDNFPNDNWRGKVLAEHEDNFDKWSKCFYESNFPKSRTESYIIISDLKHIDNKENAESGDSCGKLTRTL